MIAALSPRERRLVALALLVAAFCCLWFAVIVPVAGGFADRAAERDELIDARARGMRLMSTAGYWRGQALRQQADADRFALRAPTLEAASDQAKQRLLAVVLAQGGTVKAIRNEPGPAGEVRLRAELQLTLTQLTSSLRLLENQKPYVVLENLSVSADQAAVSGRLSPMDVSIDLAIPFVVAPA